MYMFIQAELYSFKKKKEKSLKSDLHIDFHSVLSYI